MHLAIVTAGGAGMFCGSCMHDNTLARALMARGERVTLMPTYTPLRVDEANVSDSRVFLGGISVYLEARVPFWRYIPRFLTRWVDSPAVIRLATRWGVSSDASQLGDMTVALLKGPAGPQAREVDEFAAFLARELRPDAVLFSNALLAGTLPPLRKEYSGPIVCLLQGDDIFLEGLVEPWKTRALELIRAHGRRFDGFLTHTAFYRDAMAEYLRLPLEKFRVVPLGIDLAGHDGRPKEQPGQPFTIGYFSRICPEKGLHNLIAAFRRLHARRPDARLKAGGYLGVRDQAYFERLSRDAGDLGDAFQYIGSPASHAEKVQFLKSLDVLSVPTDYKEPKGLPILEAMANGVPVVQPGHGSFPELIAQTGGGLIVPPGDPEALAAALEQLMDDNTLRLRLATDGHASVHTRFGPQAMATATLDALRTIPPGADRLV